MGLLRITLAIAVVVAHMQLSRSFMISGGQAVKIFFMISGFYMAMILQQKYGLNRAGLADFAKNRFLRLYPLYLFTLVATILWHLTCEVATHGGTPEPLLLHFSKAAPVLQSIWLWIANLGLLGTDIPSLIHWDPMQGLRFFADLPHEESNGVFWMGYAVWVRQAWSIGAEIWFYLAAPFLAFLPKLWMKVLLWVALCLFTLWLQSTHPGPAYYFWPALLSYFATGTLLFEFYQVAHLRKMVGELPLIAKRCIHFSPLIWAILLPLGGCQMQDWLQNFLAAITIPFLFAVTFDNRVDRFVGELSYGVYLNHLLVISVVAVGIKNMGLPPQAYFPLVLLSCGVFSYLTSMLIELPIDRIRARISLHAKRQSTSAP